jgi:hypothetical protein
MVARLTQGGMSVGQTIAMAEQELEASCAERRPRRSLWGRGEDPPPPLAGDDAIWNMPGIYYVWADRIMDGPCP